jgi:hypothetical protein
MKEFENPTLLERFLSKFLPTYEIEEDGFKIQYKILKDKVIVQSIKKA